MPDECQQISGKFELVQMKNPQAKIKSSIFKYVNVKIVSNLFTWRREYAFGFEFFLQGRAMCI